MGEFTNWEMHEEIGVGIPNPQSCTLITKPESMTSEEFLHILKVWSGNNNLSLLPDGRMVLNNDDAKNFKTFITRFI